MGNIAFYLWGQAQRTEIYLHSIDERERKVLNGGFKIFLTSILPPIKKADSPVNTGNGYPGKGLVLLRF